MDQEVTSKPRVVPGLERLSSGQDIGSVPDTVSTTLGSGAKGHVEGNRQGPASKYVRRGFVLPSDLIRALLIHDELRDRSAVRSSVDQLFGNAKRWGSLAKT
jgi:hypothetical protein